MRFDLTPDQQLFVDTTRRFLETETPTSIVREWAVSDLGYDAGWWSKGAQLGWTQLLAPESQGGGSVSDHRLEDLGLVANAFGRSIAPGPLVTANVCLLALDLLATAEQQAEWAAPLLNGDEHASFCFDESQLDAVSTVATPLAHGGYRLVGVKAPVEAAASASRFFVVAQTPDGLRVFVVPATATGVTVVSLGGLDLNRRFGEVRLADVEVSREHVLGGAGAEHPIRRLRRTERVLRLCETVGCLDRVFEFTCEWAFDRYSFGRPLASYQELKHRFADMKTWLEASHATTDAAVIAVDADADDADLLVHVAASYVGEYGLELLQDCVQMHGGIGVTADHDLHLFLRRATQNCGLVGFPSEHRARIATILEELS